MMTAERVNNNLPFISVNHSARPESSTADDALKNSGQIGNDWFVWKPLRMFCHFGDCRWAGDDGFGLGTIKESLAFTRRR